MSQTKKTTRPILAIFLAIGILSTSLFSCSKNQIEKNQGIFSADKAALKISMKEKSGSDNVLALGLIDKVIENAVIEFKINGDSITGLIFLAGQSNVLNSKILIQNDSMIIKNDNATIYLIPNEKGLLFKNANSELSIQMINTGQKDFSPETKKSVEQAAKQQEETKAFTENLGKWTKGNFVDDFGDKTDEEFFTSIVIGSHKNSAVVNSEVYVRTILQNGSLNFQIFNKSMTLKESFPNKELGYIKIKFPTGEVKTEKVFFYENSCSEASDDKNPLIYNYIVNNDGELKLMLDLSTADGYHSDVYQFSIQKNNLDEVRGK